MVERPTPDPGVEERISSLLDRVARSGPLRRDAVAIPGTATTLDVVRPADIDMLLDQLAGDPEQNLPYWAELWPSGVALAAAIAQAPERVRGMPALELGCGIGITAAIGLGAGAELIATDYAPESLLFTCVNCLWHTGREPRTLQINWRDPGEALLDALLADAPEGYPVVLAADVLYERRDIAPLLNLIEKIVAPDGMLWLAEPGRAPAATFLEEASRRGWISSAEHWHGPWPDPGDEGVIARVHQLRRDHTRNPS